METRVIQEWTPAPTKASIRQKVIEITVCEWWPGQKVRLPVTLNAPVSSDPCRYLIIGNTGLSRRPALPVGAALRLLEQHGVGVVLIGMGTIDAMEPAGRLHLGMKARLLETKDARYTAAWIWGISNMRALTAALAEPDVFRPAKVLGTGGSKRGLATAAAGIHDDRFTGIMPVVAPPLGNPSGPFVSGTESAEVIRINDEFLACLAAGRQPGLPGTARAALIERQENRSSQRITLQEAQDAGWTAEEIAAINDRAWDVCRTASRFAALRGRGLQIMYNVGSNDNVSPDLLEVGRRFTDFPLYIVPGGQHGGLKTTGFTRQVPSLPEVDDNLYTFALHHFFDARPLVAPPRLISHWDKVAQQLRVIVTFPDGTEPQKNELWWSVNRSPRYTLPYEYDAWQSTRLRRTGPSIFEGEAPIPDERHTVDFLTTHTHAVAGLAFSISSPMQRKEN